MFYIYFIYKKILMRWQTSNHVLNINMLLNNVRKKCQPKDFTFFITLKEEIAKKESRLKFYRMSFASHSIDICIFFMLQTEPGRSRLYLRAIYAHPIKIQLSLFVEQLKKCLVFMSGFYLNKSVKQCLFTFFKSDI